MSLDESYIDINQPHIIRYIDADDLVPSQYIIAVEKSPVMYTNWSSVFPLCYSLHF